MYSFTYDRDTKSLCYLDDPLTDAWQHPFTILFFRLVGQFREIFYCFLADTVEKLNQTALTWAAQPTVPGRLLVAWIEIGEQPYIETKVSMTTQ